MQMFNSVDEVMTISELHLDEIDKGTLKYFWLRLVSDGFGNPISIPLCSLIFPFKGSVQFL